MTLERTSPPAVAPVTPDEAKEQMLVSHSDDDAYITSLIAAAVAYVDGTGLLGRAMITQSWAQWVSQSPGWVRLKMGPFQELTSIEYYDAAGTLQTASTGDFEIRKAGDYVVLKPEDGKAWPNAQMRADAIKITYVAGYGDSADDVPASLRAAIKMLVAHWYLNREAVSAQAMENIPLGFDDLIGTERVGWYG